MTEITGGKNLKDLKPLAFDNSNRIDDTTKRVRDVWVGACM